MNEWKVRQEIFHRLHQTHSDDLNDKTIEITDNVVKDAVRYFKETDLGWIYPSKSYMVAICYAKWLAKHFGGIPEEYLDDPELLYSNDPYFVPYSRDPETYHKILNQIGSWDFNETQGFVPDVYKYFLEEFMIDAQ